VTIIAVAERAGVSAMTVSNVLNGTKTVAPATRRAVLDAVEALNYAPSVTARALRGAQELRIGLPHGAVDNGYLGLVLVGALDAASRHGVQLLVRKWHPGSTDETRAQLQQLIESGANALLLSAPICELVSATGITAQLDVPLVGLSPGAALADMASVRINELEAARDITEHLCALGHRRIGFVRGPEGHSSAHARLKGFLAARFDVDRDPALIVEGDYTFVSGLEAAARLLDLKVPPTAIVCSNDDTAAGVMAMAQRRGVRIPEDLSVTGFDDSSIATKLWPALTTVRQPIDMMADLAVEALVMTLRDGGRDGDDKVKISADCTAHEIIIRASTAAI
jgi:LacI family transcriptional regulator